MHTSFPKTPTLAGPLATVCMGFFALCMGGCGGGEEGSTGEEIAVELPASISVLIPDRPIRDMAVVEDNSEAVANRMVDFSDKLRRRDFDAALDWLAPDFVGHAFAPLAESEVEELPLATGRILYDCTSPPIVERHGFLDSIRASIGAWERVETVSWKVKAAEFQSGGSPWGCIRFRIGIQGTKEGGGPASLEAWGFARVESAGGKWLVSEFELESLTALSREAYLFRDVATAVGVARTGIRFGKPGNRNFAWNGAAAGDADGDGLVDIFIPSPRANVLYMARGESGFIDEALTLGVAEPAGGTGAVFFDMDNDGDQDLALADVGWKERDGRLGGNGLRLWVSAASSGESADKDKPSFQERGQDLGFGLSDSYSLTVFDAEQDGFLDVFVANYGRIAAEPNNSWIQATNGTPNQLYTNVFAADGTRFVEVAEARGLIDSAWSYASAAADLDMDGDQDLYVANDYGVNHLWINSGAGIFENQADALGVSDLGNGMGISFGDLDNDADLDIYVSNMSSTAGRRILSRLAKKDERWNQLSKMAAGNTIFLSGDKGFERLNEKGGLGGSWAWSSNLFDLDLDGKLDVYCCSGFVTGDTPADT